MADDEIYRLDSGLPPNEKFRLLNEMIMTLSGRISSAKFNKNELDELYDLLSETGYNFERKYLRDQSLGNTLGTYTGWSHVKAETGYSIWKYAPTNYAYNILNELYLDGQVLEFRGQANGESATTFDSVLLNEDGGGTFVDNTAEAGTEEGTQFSLLDETADYLYMGASAVFTGVKFEFQTRGSGYELEFQYWNGSSWITLTESGNNLNDDTLNWESEGLVSFDNPGDWATVAVNGVTKYWLRIKTNDVPITVAKAYYIIPANSIVGLLALSSDEIITGSWAWASYNGYIYVTLRNSGQSAYEGDYFITSSSSTANKQNFFVFNHSITANYQDSSY